MKPETKRSREERSSRFLDSYWRLPVSLDPGLVDRLSREAGIIPEVASILLRRSGSDAAKALGLLQEHSNPEAPLPDLIALPGMSRAVDRLSRARDLGEHVVIYSDFDCDGVTSAVVLKEALEHAGFEDFEVYFPSRFAEGYGFHAGSAVDLARKGASLFVTADCGISGQEACEALAALGKDVIVTDHHLPGADLPRAVSVIDPHLPSWTGYDLTGLSGAGVAYLLSLALCRSIGAVVPPSWAHDLLTLSVAGDGQPVLGPNRAWIRSGLRSIGETGRTGILSLLRVAGISGGGAPAGKRPLSFDRDVTFGLVPRINAAGRLSDPRLAFELLCTNDPLRAADLAEELDRLNRQRKEIEDRILEECWEDLSGDGYAMCAFRPGWHEGVIGIACSRIREAFGRPAVLVGGEGEVLKGSVRGVAGFNVVVALERCKNMLTAFGGHEAAGGFSIEKGKVDEFFRAFDAVSGEMLESAGTGPVAEVDEVLTVGRVTDENLRGFLRLEPFGEGNPMPQVACMDCEVIQVGLMGASLDHLQIVLGKDGVTQRFLWFGQGRNARDIAMLGRVDALFAPYRSVYRGQEQFSPLLRDMRASWSQCGLAYESLARETPCDHPVILYTWSVEAGRSLWTALRKLGRSAHLHLKGQVGAEARDARAALREGGVAVSTAPWDLGLRGAIPQVLIVHRPLDQEDLRELKGFLAPSGVRPVEAALWRRDAVNWLSWTYPEKDRLRSLWKFLTRNYGSGRVPIWDLGRRWAEVMEVAGYPEGARCLEGSRVFLQSALKVFEEVGLAAYDYSRRAPEFILRMSGDKVDLEDSRAFLAGEKARRDAEVVWQEAEGFIWRT